MLPAVLCFYCCAAVLLKLLSCVLLYLLAVAVAAAMLPLLLPLLRAVVNKCSAQSRTKLTPGSLRCCAAELCC